MYLSNIKICHLSSDFYCLSHFKGNWYLLAKHLWTSEWILINEQKIIIECTLTIGYLESTSFKRATKTWCKLFFYNYWSKNGCWTNPQYKIWADWTRSLFRVLPSTNWNHLNLLVSKISCQQVSVRIPACSTTTVNGFNETFKKQAYCIAPPQLIQFWRWPPQPTNFRKHKIGKL